MSNNRLWKKIGHSQNKRTQQTPQKIKSEKASPVRSDDEEKNIDFIKQMEELGLQTIIEVQQITHTTNEEPSYQSKFQIPTESRNQEKMRELAYALSFSKIQISKLRKSFRSLKQLIREENFHNNSLIKSFKNQSQKSIAEKIKQIQTKIKEKHQKEKYFLSKELQTEKRNRLQDIEKYQERIKEMKVMIKNLDTKLRSTEQNLKNYSSKIFNLEKERGELIQAKIGLEVRVNKFQSKIIEGQRQKEDQESYYAQIEEERANLFEENRALKRKIQELDEEVEKRIQQELQKVREESQKFQNQFYLKQMQALNEEVIMIREKYHEKNSQFQKRQSILALKESQVEQSKEIIEKQRFYLEEKEDQLSSWEHRLTTQSQQLEKEKQSISTIKTPKAHRYQRNSHKNMYESLGHKHYYKAEKDHHKNSFKEGFNDSYHKNHHRQKEDEGFNRNRESLANFNGLYSYNGKFRRSGVEEQKKHYKPMKERKLDYEINNLDSRLKNIQLQMKKQIQELKNKL